MVIGLAAAALVISVAALLLPDRLGSPQEPAVTEPPLPSQGWFLIQPAHVSDHRFCVGEGRERNHRTNRPLAVQRPCAAIVPDTYLAATAIGGVYEIQWHHPKEGVGCLTVDEALTADETLVAPDKCPPTPPALPAGARPDTDGAGLPDPADPQWALPRRSRRTGGCGHRCRDRAVGLHRSSRPGVPVAADDPFPSEPHRALAHTVR